MRLDIADLVDNPRESQEIELKGWIDPTERITQANLARHIAALANHGGGYIVFGFRDDTQRDPSRPPSLEVYNRDVFGGIIKRYLSPPFQCEIVNVAATSGGELFPILRVPGHGSIPICAIRDGPQDSKGAPQGIRSAIYYIRSPKPESEPITSPEVWLTLIRRCVVNDRDALLGDLASILQAQRVPTKSLEETLANWHGKVEERFSGLVANTPVIWPVALEENHCQLSYLISHADEEVVPSDRIIRALEETNNEVRNTVWTGWSMFYPFTRSEIAPYFQPERADGTGSDVLEASLLADRDFDYSLPDFWRVTPNGRASIIRAYREDRSRNADRDRQPGSWLSPETVVRETAELVGHARAFAKHFPSASRVAFRCTWKGLRGRELMDFDPSIRWTSGRIAKADTRTTLGEWPAAELSPLWDQVVAALACPILNLFGFTDCSPALVRGLAPRFIKL